MRTELQIDWTDPIAVGRYCATLRRVGELTPQQEVWQMWSKAALQRHQKDWKNRWCYAKTSKRVHLCSVRSEYGNFVKPVCRAINNKKPAKVVSEPWKRLNCSQCLKIFNRSSSLRFLVKGKPISPQAYWRWRDHAVAVPVAKILSRPHLGFDERDYQRLEFVDDPRRIEQVFTHSIFAVAGGRTQAFSLVYHTAPN